MSAKTDQGVKLSQGRQWKGANHTQVLKGARVLGEVAWGGSGLGVRANKRHQSLKKKESKETVGQTGGGRQKDDE